MEVGIHCERPEDYDAITAVNDAAFGRPNEGRLVASLRNREEFNPSLSLVAEINGDIVGHILFHPVKIKSGNEVYESVALAPMCVLPELQRKGIGSLLVNEGIRRLKKLGYKSVIVLGHAEYYPRFGFKAASLWNINSPVEVPDDVFMVLELTEGELNLIQGTVEYPPEFSYAE